MRLALVGAVETSRTALNSLMAHGVMPELVVALPADRGDRHSDFVDVGGHARRRGVSTLAAANINSSTALAALREARLDVLLVVGWSQILGSAVMGVAPQVIGFHPSLLPTNRGRGVIPWTILQRSQQSGVSLFFIDEKVDHGDLIIQRSFTLDADETARTLYNKCLVELEAAIGGIVAAWPTLPRRPQEHDRATYCARRVPDDGRIDWTQPAETIWTLIRASTNPYPGAFSEIEGSKVTMWRASLLGGGERHWAMPGQVVEADGGGFAVSCGDRNLVWIDHYDIEPAVGSQDRNPIRLHVRFIRS